MKNHELKEMRKKMGLTQKQLSDKLGIYQSNLSKMESGIIKIPLYIEKHIKLLKIL